MNSPRLAVVGDEDTAMAMLDQVLVGDDDLRAFYAERPEQARAIAYRVRCQLPWLLAAMADAETGPKRASIREERRLHKLVCRGS